MAELMRNSPDQPEPEEWLLKLSEKGIEISEDEAELLKSESSLGNLLAHVLLEEANFRSYAGDRQTALLSEKESLDTRFGELRSSYESLLDKAHDPAAVATGAVSTEEISGIARVLDQMGKASESLETEAGNLRINSSETFRLIRGLIVEVARRTPDYPGAKNIELENPTSEGFASLIKAAREILPAVVTDTSQNFKLDRQQIKDIPAKEAALVKKNDVKPETFTVQDSGNLFSSWEEVFGADQLKKLKKENPNFVLEYRFAIQAIIKKYPERFTKYKNPEGSISEYDWIGAIDEVLTLNVSELNAAIKTNNPRTLNTTARILALAKRFNDKEGIFTHHEEISELARKVRQDTYPEETKLEELFKTEAELKASATAQASGLSHGDIYTDDRKNRKAEKKDNKAEMIDLVFNTLKEIYRQTSEQQISLEFPQKTVTQPQISKYWRPGGKRMTARFLTRMDDEGLVSPSGPIKPRSHPGYTESDVVKLYLLKLRNVDRNGKTQDIVRFTRDVEEAYTEARKKFDAFRKNQT